MFSKRRIHVSLGIVAIVGAVMLAAGVAYAAVDQEFNTIQGVSMRAQSEVADIGNEWFGVGESRVLSGGAISNISVSSVGAEQTSCFGWQNRWSDNDSQPNSTLAVAGDATGFVVCGGVHMCRTSSTHNFVKSGAFGWSPSTSVTIACS